MRWGMSWRCNSQWNVEGKVLSKGAEVQYTKNGWRPNASIKLIWREEPRKYPNSYVRCKHTFCKSRTAIRRQTALPVKDHLFFGLWFFSFVLSCKYICTSCKVSIHSMSRLKKSHWVKLYLYCRHTFILFFLCINSRKVTRSADESCLSPIISFLYALNLFTLDDEGNSTNEPFRYFFVQISLCHSSSSIIFWTPHMLRILERLWKAHWLSSVVLVRVALNYVLISID